MSNNKSTANAPETWGAQVWRFAARAACAAVVALSMFGAPTAARADSTGYNGGLPFHEAFRRAVDAMLIGMEDGSCYQREGVGRLKMAFVGIPPNTVYFSDLLRNSLNSSAKDTIQEYFRSSIDLLSTETFQTIAALSRINAADQLQLRNAIRNIEAAPLVLVITAGRPAKNIVQLKLELFARTNEQVQVCPKSELLFIDLDNKFASIPQHLLPTDSIGDSFVEQRWAFTHALREIAPTMRGFKNLDVEMDLQMAGNCRLSSTAESLFRSRFSDAEQEMIGQLSLRPGEWPTLALRSRRGSAQAASAEADVERAVLSLTLALDPNDSEVYDLTLQLNQGDRNLLTRFYRVLVNTAMIQGCTPFAHDFLTNLVQTARGGPGKAIQVRTSKARYAVDQDQVSIRISANEQKHLYCWVLATDETAYILLPWSEKMAEATVEAGKPVNYPDDYLVTSGLEEGLRSGIVYRAAARELFGCFATTDRLPAEIEQRWISMHYRNGGGDAPEGALTASTVRQFIDQIRALPGITEDYAWIVAE